MPDEGDCPRPANVARAPAPAPAHVAGERDATSRSWASACRSAGWNWLRRRRAVGVSAGEAGCITAGSTSSDSGFVWGGAAPEGAGLFNEARVGSKAAAGGGGSVHRLDQEAPTSTSGRADGDGEPGGDAAGGAALWRVLHADWRDLLVTTRARRLSCRFDDSAVGLRLPPGFLKRPSLRNRLPESALLLA
jgi:hypothetical protein